MQNNSVLKFFESLPRYLRFRLLVDGTWNNNASLQKITVRDKVAIIEVYTKVGVTTPCEVYSIKQVQDVVIVSLRGTNEGSRYQFKFNSFGELVLRRNEGHNERFSRTKNGYNRKIEISGRLFYTWECFGLTEAQFDSILMQNKSS